MGTNLKDQVTVICAMLTALAAAIVALPSTTGIIPPPWLTTTGLIMGAVALVISQVFIGKNANGTTKSDAQVAKQADPAKPDIKAAFPVTKVLAIIFLLGFASTAQAQTFENFWHPRPAAAKAGMFLPYAVTGTTTLWEFKPMAAFTFLSFRPSSVSGQPWESGMLAGGGPALSFVNSGQDSSGNYINFAISFAILFQGDTKSDPNFQPALALFFAAPKIIPVAQVGVEYDLAQRIVVGGPNLSRIALVLSFTLYPTLN